MNKMSLVSLFNPLVREDAQGKMAASSHVERACFRDIHITIFRARFPLACILEHQNNPSIAEEKTRATLSSIKLMFNTRNAA